MGFDATIPKPIAHIIPPNVWKATVHLARLLPCHRQQNGRNLTDTIVREIGEVSAETSVKKWATKVS